MINTEMPEFARELATRELVEFVQRKTDLTEIGAFAYALSLCWSLSENKLKEKVVSLIEEANP